MSSNQHTSGHVGTGITKIHSHKASYTWIIEDFNFYETRGEELNSSFFSAKTNDEFKWYLTLEPNVGSKGKRDISLFLKLLPKNNIAKVFVKITIYLLDDKLKELFCTPVDENEQVGELDPADLSWGWDSLFTSINEKFRSEYLPNNKLTIRCDVTFSDMRKNDVYGFEVPICNITESVAKLYEDHEFADAIISVNGKDYPVHKSILCARSPVFAAMFRQKIKDDELDRIAQGLVANDYNWDGLKIQNTKENQRNRIEICDIKEEVVGEMLRYVYTGECEILESFVEDLLAAADKYGLGRLKMMCAEVLFRNLSSENVAHILILAEIHGMNEVKSEAIKFIASRFDEVMNTEGWKKVFEKPELISEVCLAFYRIIAKAD